MPSIVTHHLFAMEVFDMVPRQIQEKISKSHYLLFAQSFDNLFYYKFLTPWKGKEIRQFGEEAQKVKVNLYFENILNEIVKNHLEENKEVLAYLYGSICHYVLDYHCHPFVFYHTGLSSLDKKYRGLHERMEVNLDAYMYKLIMKKDLYKEQLADTLLPKVVFSHSLIKVMNQVYFKTFQKEKMGIIYDKSRRMGNFLLKYGVTDRTGLKKLLYTLKDLLVSSNRKYQYLSFHVTEFVREYLNENHEIWNNPVDKKMTSNKSFVDLYEDAKNTALVIIKAIDEYMYEKNDLQKVLDIIGNNSYATGLDCDKSYALKYFKD